jgi:hypothetical protein
MNDLQLKALQVIEALTTDDFVINEKLIDEIYKIAHVALGHCTNPHEDWKEELLDTHTKMVERGVISRKVKDADTN